jgi:hypothetical protein
MFLQPDYPVPFTTAVDEALHMFILSLALNGSRFARAFVSASLSTVRTHYNDRSLTVVKQRQNGHDPPDNMQSRQLWHFYHFLQILRVFTFQTDLTHFRTLCIAPGGT